jgi:signal transduction histidine kinase
MSTTQKTRCGHPGTTPRPLRVLLVEDSEPDARLLERALERGGFAVTTRRVDTAESMESALQERVWDLILCDHAMPRFSAPEALNLLKQHRLDVPFIIVSGYIEEETAVAAMKAGAHDYIMKDRLARLVPAVERELRDAEVRRAREKFEADLRKAHEELELRVEQRTADLRAANLQLENVIEERKRLENELLEIAENERRRIGFDLHDDIGQKLTGLSLMLKGLEQRLAAEQHPCVGDARKTQAIIDEVIHYTHNLARQFASLDVKGDDLTAVLKGLAGNVKKMFDIACGCTVKGSVPELPPHTTVQLYKIAQEAVSNAIKHGKASQVTIGLAREHEHLVMTVRNDGVPFSKPESAKNRMGLRIMNYRANTIGARLEIQPQEKSGTIVTCALPIKNGHGMSHRRISSHSKPMMQPGPFVNTDQALFGDKG